MKKLFTEFKKFISRGNVVDMAVGVAVAGAFTKIVTAFTTGFITPLLALLSNDADLTEFKWVLREAVVKVAEDGTEIIERAEVALMWGAFVQTIIDFLIIAGALFVVMKAFNAAADRAKKMREELREDLTPERIKAEAEAKAKAEAEAKAAAEAEAKAKAEEARRSEQKEKNKGSVQALIISILSLAAAGGLFYYVDNIIDDGVLTPVFSLLWILYFTVALWFLYKKCAKEYRRLPRLILCGTLIAHIAIKYTLDQAWAEMPIGSTILAVFLAGWAILLIWGYAFVNWNK